MANNKAQMPNQIQNLNAKVYDLEERTAQFGREIIAFAKTISQNPITKPLISQIVRSATSIGANYCEADGADSKKDFIHKIGLCKRESKETKHWLKMIVAAAPEQKNICQKHSNESQELTLIFSSIIKKSREDLK